MRRAESTGNDGEQDLRMLFTKITAVLAAGNLTFDAPFDLATSAALAANIDVGHIAQMLFEVTAQRRTGFRVQIHAVADGVPDREIVATTVANESLLVELLDALIEEYCARQNEGDLSGG